MAEPLVLSSKDLELTSADLENPVEVAPVPTHNELMARHSANRAAEAVAYNQAQSDTGLAAAGLRGAGAVAGMLPLAGPFLAGGADVAAQMVEKAGGQRQTYNPIRTAAEVGLNAIPGLPIAKLARPTTGIMANAGRAAMITGAHALEGAGRGALAAGITPLSEGEMPTGEQVKTGAVAGAVLSPLASVFNLNQMRRSTQRATASYNAASHIAKAINLPEAAEHGAENLQQGVGLALTHAAAKSEPVQTLKDLARVSEDARQTFAQAHIDPLKQRFGGQIINPAPILKKAEQGMKAIHYEADPGLQSSIQPARDILSKPRTASELLEYYHILQNEVQPFLKSDPAMRAQKFGDAEWRFKLRLKDELQNKLADHFDQSRALQEGTTVDALRSSGNGFKAIHRQYGSLAFLSNLSKKADTRLDNIRMGQAGELTGAGEAAEKVLSPIFLSKRRMAGQALDMIVGGRNDPDNLVKKAQKVFSKYGTPTPQPSTMPEQLGLPAMGETGEPSLGDFSGRLPENRAAGKRARQRQEGSRLLTGQTRSDFANQPAPGEPTPLQPGEMELSPGQVPSRTSAARPSPITIAPPPDMRVSGMPPAKPRIRVRAGGPVQGDTVPLTIAPVPEPPAGSQTGYTSTESLIPMTPERQALWNVAERQQQALRPPPRRPRTGSRLSSVEEERRRFER